MLQLDICRNTNGDCIRGKSSAPSRLLSMVQDWGETHKGMLGALKHEVGGGQVPMNEAVVVHQRHLAPHGCCNAAPLCMHTTSESVHGEVVGLMA